MEDNTNNIISIYTPSITLNSPEEYANRARFLFKVLTSENCSYDEAKKVAAEIINIVNYLNLVNQRRIFLEEQQKANELEQEISEKQQETIKPNPDKK